MIAAAGRDRHAALQRMTRGLVCIVDDDLSMREALSSLLRSMDFAVETFDSAAAFLAANAAELGLCLILDVCMPEMNGLELQQRLRDMGARIPIVFMTARPDKQMEARALAAGAVAFLTKPLDNDALLAALESSLAP